MEEEIALEFVNWAHVFAVAAPTAKCLCLVQLLVMTATFLRKGGDCPGAMTQMRIRSCQLVARFGLK